MAFITKFKLQSFRNQVNELTESQRSSIERAGFGSLLQIPYHVLRRNQMIELMDTWSTEKQAFIFPPGEITITLLDVSLILGLRVIGEPVVLEEDSPLTSLEEKLGASVSNRTVTVESLKAKLDDIGKKDDDESFVRVFLLFSFGTLLFPTANGKVDSRYIALIQDVDSVSSFAWGAAVLKDLHDCLNQRKSKKATNVNGCLILLQIWCYEHVITGRPKLLDSKFPRVCRWESSARNYSTPQFTIKFKELESSQILLMLQPTSEEIRIDIIKEIPQEWYLRTGPGTIEEPIDIESERSFRMTRVNNVEEEDEEEEEEEVVEEVVEEEEEEEEEEEVEEEEEEEEDPEEDSEEDPEEDPEEDENMADANPENDVENEEKAEVEKVNMDVKSENVDEKGKDDQEEKAKFTSKSEVEKKEKKENRKVDSKKKEIPLDKQLLQAFRFFDRNRVGYVRVEDLRLILHALGKCMSHRDAKELVQSALLESNTGRDDRILYTKLVKMTDI